MSDADVQALMDWLLELDARTPTVASTSPCVIVTPLGLQQRAAIEALFARHHVQILGREVLPNWARLSTAIQVRRRTEVAIRRAVIFERLWRERYPEDLAEAWLVSREAHALLSRLKRTLRAHLHNASIETPLLARAASLHAFHLADEDDVDAESRRRRAAQVMLSTPSVNAHRRPSE